MTVEYENALGNFVEDLGRENPQTLAQIAQRFRQGENLGICVAQNLVEAAEGFMQTPAVVEFLNVTDPDEKIQRLARVILALGLLIEPSEVLIRVQNIIEKKPQPQILMTAREELMRLIISQKGQAAQKIIVNSATEEALKLAGFTHLYQSSNSTLDFVRNYTKQRTASPSEDIEGEHYTVNLGKDKFVSLYASVARFIRQNDKQ